MDNSVTVHQSMTVSTAIAYLNGNNGMRTYIVVSVLDQERDARALCALPAGIALQLVLGRGDIVDQLAIREAAARRRVDDGGALGVVLLDGLEDGQAGQGGRHSDYNGGTRALGKGGCLVPGERVREEIACPHGDGSAQDQHIRFRLQMQGVGLRQLCGGAVQPASQSWGCSRGCSQSSVAIELSLVAHFMLRTCVQYSAAYITLLRSF